MHLIRASQGLLACILILHGISATAQKAKDNYPYISIAQIKTHAADTFRIQGKVLSRFTCPPCPKGAICKPCIGDHIMVTGTEEEKDQLMIFTPQPDEFDIKSVYVFTLRLHLRDRPEYGADLIHSESLKK